MAGVWTPRAEVLCGRCHGPSFPHRANLDAAEFERWCTAPALVSDDTGETVCTRCGREVRVDAPVAAYARLRDRLHAQGEAGAPRVLAKLEQTGGMCSALSVRREGTEAPVVFVSGLDDGDLFHVGLYATEDDVYEAAGEDCGAWATEDDAAGAVRNALVGGA